MSLAGIGNKFKHDGKKWVVIDIENKMYTIMTHDKKEKRIITSEEMEKMFK
jgi:hypothetical protein